MMALELGILLKPKRQKCQSTSKSLYLSRDAEIGNDVISVQELLPATMMVKIKTKQK